MIKISSLIRTQFQRVAGTLGAGCTRLVACPCQLCGTENKAMICVACQHQFFNERPARCLCCAIPLSEHDQICGTCLSDPPAFEQTWVACDYAAPLDQLVLSLKFDHQLSIAPALAQRLAAATNRLNQPLPELLIPVPLSPARLAQRGFNQSLEIARPLARQLQLPLYPQLLQRVRETTAQSLLPPHQRRQNILHAFAPDEEYEDKIRGRHVGVVDDVMTTGATLHEIAACLRRHGAQRVTNLVFARTPPH